MTRIRLTKRSEVQRLVEKFSTLFVGEHFEELQMALAILFCSTCIVLGDSEDDTHEAIRSLYGDETVVKLSQIMSDSTAAVVKGGDA